MQEVTEELVRKKIRDPSDFEWLKQSRFHWREDRDTVITSICDVDFEYSFEYLGAKTCQLSDDTCIHHPFSGAAFNFLRMRYTQCRRFIYVRLPY